MNNIQIILDLLDRGFAGEVSATGHVLCTMPKPLQNYGFSLESFGSEWISCLIWESCGGGILGREGFRDLDSLIVWVSLVVAHFDAAVSADLADLANWS